MTEIPIKATDIVRVNSYITAMQEVTTKGVISREPDFKMSVNLTELSELTNLEFLNRLKVTLSCAEEIQAVLNTNVSNVADIFNMYALSLYSNVYSRFNTTISYLQCCRKLLSNRQGYLLISERKLKEYLDCLQLLGRGTSSLFIKAIYTKFFIKFIQE